MNDEQIKQAEEMLELVVERESAPYDSGGISTHSESVEINIRYYPSMGYEVNPRWKDTGIGMQDVEWMIFNEEEDGDTDMSWAIFKFDIGYAAVLRSDWSDYTFSSTTVVLEVCHTFVFSEFAEACLTEEQRRHPDVAALLLEDAML